MKTTYKNYDSRDFQTILKNEAPLFETFYERTFEPILFWQEGMIISANSAMCDLIGFNKMSLQMHTLDDFICKDQTYYATFNELYSKGYVEGEVNFSFPDGEIISLLVTLKLNTIKNYHIAIFHSVNNEYFKEKELLDSENKFRNLFESSQEGLILWDDQFKLINMNPAAKEMLGVTKETILGSSLMELCSQCKLERQELKEKVDRTAGTFQYTLKNGMEKTFEFSTQHQVFSQVNVTSLKDISERLILEEQLRKSETLHVLGELAAGIAHEVRNPLTALKGFIQLLEASVQEDFSMYFNVITTELARIETIINEFLYLSKPQALSFSDEDISFIMNQTLDLLSAQAVLHNIQFVTHIPENLSKVNCVPNQLKKVFINMIKNAIEVMPDGGYITIYIKMLADDQIRISIIDQGAGIEKEKLKKLGEPFYTTKERGTGLGLMVTYKIIEEHGGTIEVESEVGKGTAFHVYLPVSQSV